VVSDVINDSQGYFTKDYVGRILFSCLIHGKQIREEAEGTAVEPSDSGWGLWVG
jgi:hypothetical protein